MLMPYLAKLRVHLYFPEWEQMFIILCVSSLFIGKGLLLEPIILKLPYF